MKLTHLFLIALLTFGLTACKGSNDQASTPAEPAAPAHGEPGHDHATDAPAQQMSGSVVETMNTAGYTYIKVKTDHEEIWAAAPEFPVNVGDKVVIPQGMAMPNYHSNTLNRDFDVVYFVSSVLVAGQDAPLNPGEAMGDAAEMGHQKPMTAPMDLDFSGLTKPENGYTIAEIFAQKDALATKEVILRAKVAKFSPKIMKTNWIHLQDGTGEAGSNDLTVTTSSEAAVGQTVLVKGILDLNQDFGYGYQYDLIIQDAKITVE